jgi:hypothetical protein
MSAEEEKPVVEEAASESAVNDELQTSLRQWIQLDDEVRGIQTRLKEIRDAKARLGDVVLRFMRENELDDFKLDGMLEGTISRSVRTIKPPIKRNTIRTQLLLHFGDQPQRVSEALRAIEGIPEDAEDMSVGSGQVRELLTRRLPRKPRQVGSLTLK